MYKANSYHCYLPEPPTVTGFHTLTQLYSMSLLGTSFELTTHFNKTSGKTVQFFKSEGQAMYEIKLKKKTKIQTIHSLKLPEIMCVYSN